MSCRPRRTDDEPDAVSWQPKRNRATTTGGSHPGRTSRPGLFKRLLLNACLRSPQPQTVVTRFQLTQPIRARHVDSAVVHKPPAGQRRSGPVTAMQLRYPHSGFHCLQHCSDPCLTEFQLTQVTFRRKRVSTNNRDCSMEMTDDGRVTPVGSRTATTCSYATCRSFH